MFLRQIRWRVFPRAIGRGLIAKVRAGVDRRDLGIRNGRLRQHHWCLTLRNVNPGAVAIAPLNWLWVSEFETTSNNSRTPW